MEGGARHPGPVRRDVVGRRVAPGAGLDSDFTYSVIERPVPTKRGEKRSDRRIASHLREALIREPRGRPIADCRILDLSRTGARLRLDRERPLPRSFLLREVGTGRAFSATLVWQAGRDAGVRLAIVDESKRS